MKHSKKTFFKMKHFKLYVILLVSLLLLFYLRFIVIPHNNTQPKLYTPAQSKQIMENRFNSIVMPNNFKLVSSTYGHEGPSGTQSITRIYKTENTRKEVLDQLKPALEKAGFALDPDDYPYGAHFFAQYFDQNTFGTSLTINLYSKEGEAAKNKAPDMSTDENYDDPDMKVSEIKLLLD